MKRQRQQDIIKVRRWCEAILYFSLAAQLMCFVDCFLPPSHHLSRLEVYLPAHQRAKVGFFNRESLHVRLSKVAAESPLSGTSEDIVETNSTSNMTSSEVFWESVMMPHPSSSSSSPSELQQHSFADSSEVTWKEVVMPRPLDKSQLHDHITRLDIAIVASTLSLGIAAMWFIMQAVGPKSWRYFLSGGICAAASHAIPVPIDVIKTRRQVDYSLSDKTFLESARVITRKEGIKALFGGFGPTLVGYFLEGAIKFGTYEILKPMVRKILASLALISPAASFLTSHTLAYVICGGLSGFAASITLCPMEALRIRLVAQPNFASNWVKGGYKMLKKEGAGSMWKGVLPMIYKQVPYTITKNVSFDLITRSVYTGLKNRGHELTASTMVTVPFFSAMVASVLSCISSQPGDMLLSLVNAYEGNRRTNDIARDILRSERGIRGFFVGTKTRLVHVGIIVTLQLLIYDFVKRLCGIAATGSV